MYNAFFGFQKAPFATPPDPEFFFRSHQHDAALNGLRMSIDARMGRISLVGDKGTGKTLLLECLRNSLGSDTACAFLRDSRTTVDRFFETIASDLNLEVRSKKKSGPQIFLALTRLVTEQAQSGRTVVLLVDEAENLPPDVFGEIVYIASMQHGNAKAIQTVVAGRPESYPRLATLNPDRKEPPALLRCSLYPFTGQETQEYIEFRLACAGVPNQTIFPRELLEEIHGRSQGFASEIHALCDQLLLRAFSVKSLVCTQKIRDQVFQSVPIVTTGASMREPPPMRTVLLRIAVDARLGSLSTRPAGTDERTSYLATSTMPMVFPSGRIELAGPQLGALQFPADNVASLRATVLAQLPLSASRFGGMEPPNLIPAMRLTATVLSASLHPSGAIENKLLPLPLSNRPIPPALETSTIALSNSDPSLWVLPPDLRLKPDDPSSPFSRPALTWVPQTANFKIPWATLAGIMEGTRKRLASGGKPLVAFVITALAAFALYREPAAVHAAAATSRQEWRRAQRAVLKRAAVALDEDFRAGLSGWTNRGGSRPSWSSDASSFVRPGALALYRPSRGLTDYEMQFVGTIHKNGLGWVARAADFDNYYAIKLTVLKPGPLPLIGVTRYAVLHGIPQKRITTPLLLRAQADTVYRVRLDVQGDHFALKIQDQPVDSWSEPRLEHGGIGFFSEQNSESSIASLHVRGHYDMLGRLCAFLMPPSISNNR